MSRKGQLLQSIFQNEGDGANAASGGNIVLMAAVLVSGFGTALVIHSNRKKQNNTEAAAPTATRAYAVGSVEMGGVVEIDIVPGTEIIKVVEVGTVPSKESKIAISI